MSGYNSFEDTNHTGMDGAGMLGADDPGDRSGAAGTVLAAVAVQDPGGVSAYAGEYCAGGGAGPRRALYSLSVMRRGVICWN